MDPSRPSTDKIGRIKLVRARKKSTLSGTENTVSNAIADRELLREGRLRQACHATVK